MICSENFYTVNQTGTRTQERSGLMFKESVILGLFREINNIKWQRFFLLKVLTFNGFITLQKSATCTQLQTHVERLVNSCQIQSIIWVFLHQDYYITPQDFCLNALLLHLLSVCTKQRSLSGDRLGQTPLQVNISSRELSKRPYTLLGTHTEIICSISATYSKPPPVVQQCEKLYGFEKYFSQNCAKIFLGENVLKKIVKNAAAGGLRPDPLFGKLHDSIRSWR